MKGQRQIFGAISGVLLGLYGLAPITSCAQTVSFSTADPGVTKSIDEWGVEVVVYSSDDMRQSIAHMGAQNIDLIAVNYWLDEPLQANGQIGPNSMGKIDGQLAIAAIAGNKHIILGPNVGSTDPSYMNGSQALVPQWVKLLQATKSYLNSKGFTLGAAMPFNEPDYWSGQGTQQNLHDILLGLKNDPNFNGVALVGASTLSSNPAQSWYDAIKDVATHGSTHGLGGSANAYANFLDYVKNTGRIGSTPELHGLGEAIYAAQYGAQSAQWWRAARRARGLFVQTSDGKQLGYAENRGAATAATVYRAPDGNIRAFAGGFERLGTSTAYQLRSTDRDVYFNGVGPMRQYMIQAGGSEEAYADIDYDNNILPGLDGYQWKIVNKQTGFAMEVANSGTDDGALIRAAADTGAANQKWNIVRTKDGYYELFNANSGRTAEVADASLLNNASVRQWGMADNLTQHWYIDDAGSGYYFLRNGNSNKYMTANTSNNIQQDNTAQFTNFQQFKFVLSNPVLPPKALYSFQGNTNSSVGTYHGTASGNPVYGNGPTGQGQAITLDGVDDYVTLPSGVASSKDITIAADVKWDGGGGWQRIFDFGTGTSSYMFLTPSSGSNTMRFAITTGSGEQILDTDPLPTGQWVHLALTLGGNTAILFVDGKPRVAGQILLNPSDINPTLNYIGKSQFNDPLFKGMIDDFRIYDYALDPGQIGSLVYHRWTGELSSSWTTTTLSNPKNWQYQVAAEDYVNGNGVLFDDYALNFTVNLTDATLNPGSTQFDNTRNNYIVNGPGALAGSGTLTKNGGGALTINSANTYSGGTVLNGGTINLNNASAIGTGALTVAGGAIDNTSGSPITLSTNNAQTWNGDFTFGGTNALNMGSGAVTLTGNRTVTVNGTGALTVGPIGESGAGRQLTKAGSGTLVLTGTTSYTGTTYVTGGTLSVAGNLNAVGNDVWIGYGAGGNGNLNVPSGGTVTANVLLIGAGGSPTALATGTGTLASGGTINTRQWFVIGQSGAAGSSGSFTLNGGTLNVHTNAAAGNLEVGTFDPCNATLDINAGSTVKLLNNASIAMGAQGNHTGTSIVNQNGGNVTSYSDGGATVGGASATILGTAGTGNYTYNLNGGTLTTPQVRKDSGGATGTFNFNGGTLKPTSAQPNFMTGLSRANLRNGGAIIDTNGLNITIAQPLVHSNVAGDAATDGGLTKSGGGTLTLQGANTYTGATTVQNGTLRIENANLTSSSGVAITGGRLELPSSGTQLRVIKTGSVSVTGTGQIDLADNKLIATASPAGTWNGSTYTDVTGLVTSGRNGNALPLWDGAGIVTTQTAATGGNFTSIGVARASDVKPATATATAMWAGQLITGTDTLVMYTYGGDATLDGKINIDDYVRIDSGAASGLSGWSNGDFNYDGKVNIDDYTTVIDANIGNQSGVFPTAGGVEGRMSSVIAVPEPAAITLLLAMTSAGLLRRRRRAEARRARFNQ